MRPATALAPRRAAEPGRCARRRGTARRERRAGGLCRPHPCGSQVRKVHHYRLDAFDSGDAGPLGLVEQGVCTLFPALAGRT